MTILFDQVQSGLAIPDLEAAKGIAVLILANNEATTIGASVRSVRNALEPQDAVFVIADNCQDDTAFQAAEAGAFTLERRSGIPAGKGAALKWGVEQGAVWLDNFASVLILDADNLIPQNFLRHIKTEYKPGTVMQCFVQPVGYQGSALSTLIALSEIHEQKTVDWIRTRLGWPVRLRGTGMVIPTETLKAIGNLIDTEVEDIALSLLLASRQISVQRNNRACVYDPKPRESVLASRQRARWFRGQWVAAWRYRREVWNLIKRGPAGWSMLSSLFCKPRWLMDGILLLLAVGTAQLSWFLAMIFLTRALFDLICLGYTILTSEDRNIFLKAILHLPTFIVMWLRSILLAFQKNSWMRARP